jgi:basic amino acid/polyamine antiporter, APA family
MPAEAPADTEKQETTGLVRGLSLGDGVLLVIGGVIGSAIFLVPSDVAAALPAPALFLGVWVAGGVLSLMAALAFSELGAMFPEAGGQYVYLREAYGGFAAFLYGWLMFVAGSTGGIAAIAVAFAVYMGKLIRPLQANLAVLALPGIGWKSGHLFQTAWNLTRGDLVAVGAIVLLTVINVLGLRRGIILLNVATWLKYAAITAFVVLGFLVGKGSWSHFNLSGVREAFAGGMGGLGSAIGIAFIAVFWCYEGWVYVPWVAGEMRDPERNIPRSLVLGLLGVVVLYCSANAAYLYALPTSAMARQDAIGQAATQVLFSPGVAFWMSAVIAVCCFSATSSNILAGARIAYAMGRDGLFFRRMGNVHPQYRTPAFALVVQGVWACAIALTGTYDQLFTYTVFGMILSYLATIFALFVLRRTRADLPRPYRCAGYPWMPALYLVLIAGWLANTTFQRPKEALSCLVLSAIGAPGYLYWRRRTRLSVLRSQSVPK